MAGVAARRICSLGWIVCGTLGHFARQGLPLSLAELAGHSAMGG
jgi:hypothetical protein